MSTPVTPFNRRQVAQRARASRTNVPGMCQAWTREKAGAPSAGDFDGDGSTDAEDGWKMEPARYKHPGDRKPPEGTICSWTGGSADSGHRAVSLGPDDRGVYHIRSTDAGGQGVVATVPLDWVEKTWGLRYEGWSDTCDGWLIPKPPPRAKPDYHWYQPGALDSPESGCAMGVLREFGTLANTTRSTGSARTSEGGGIRERSILRGRVGVAKESLAFPAVVGHAPPPRAPKARARFMRAFNKVRGRFKGGDLNLGGRAVARLTGRKVVGAGVLWLVLPRGGWKVVSWRAVDVDGDHKAILVNVRHNRTGVVMRVLVINAMSVSAPRSRAEDIFANGLDLHPDLVLATECSDFRARRVDLADAA